MKFSKDIFVIAAVAISVAFLEGCLIPLLGFGYSGYQYHEKEGVFAPGQPLGGPAPADSSKKSSDSASKPPPQSNDNIE
jgi:hypothetical protein